MKFNWDIIFFIERVLWFGLVVMVVSGVVLVAEKIL